MRGRIEKPERARQIVTFEGLRYGKITPTDIDGLIEYHDQAYIIIEIKYKQTQVKKGQKIALERLVEDTAKSNKQSIAIVVEHEQEDTDKTIVGSQCKTREIYLSEFGEWKETPTQPTLKEVCNWFIQRIDKNKQR